MGDEKDPLDGVEGGRSVPWWAGKPLKMHQPIPMSPADVAVEFGLMGKARDAAGGAGPMYVQSITPQPGVPQAEFEARFGLTGEALGSGVLRAVQRATAGVSGHTATSDVGRYPARVVEDEGFPRGTEDERRLWREALEAFWV